MAKRRRSGRRSPAAAGVSSSSDKPSAVSSLLPGDEPAASSSSSSDQAEPGAGSAAPPLPPDPGGDEPADGADAGAPRGDRGASSSSDQEGERIKRVLVLRVSFGAMFASLPPHLGGGPLTEDESQMLADAWELPLRPYWDQIFGPWMGAVFATFAVVGPRVIAARAKLRAAGVEPGAQVG